MEKSTQRKVPRKKNPATFFRELFSEEFFSWNLFPKIKKSEKNQL